MRSRASYEKGLVLSREAKRRRQGTCVRCGAPTHYAGYKGQAVAPHCRACGAIVNGEQQRGTGPVQQKILALLHERGEMRFSEFVDEFGWSRNDAGARLTMFVQRGFLVRVRRGVYRAAA